MRDRIEMILSRLTNVEKETRGRWRATCPTHGSDKNKALNIFDNGDKIGIYCHAGCTHKEILQEIGLKEQDLFMENGIDLHQYRQLQAEKRQARQADRLQTQLYQDICVLKQVLESRMYSGEPMPKTIVDAWGREKQAVRRLPGLLKQYYKGAK